MSTGPTFRKHLRSLVSPSLVSLLFTVTIAAQQPAGDSTQAKPPASTAITGRVISESGQPLPGVRVSVLGAGTSNGLRTATDNEGNFRALGLDAGAYRIFVSSPSYVTEIPDPNSSISYYRPGDSATLTLVKGGVIAGTVTNGAGEPLVNATVRVLRIRDSEGKPIQAGNRSPERVTDDRGYYRIYGLQPGSYVVSAGGSTQFFSGAMGMNAYANEAPTYAPASTRDTATEIVVRSGQEAAADIRYRGEPGHSISGRVTGVQTPQPYGSGVRLTDIESHAMISATSATGDDRTFELNGVADGDYEISALAGSGPDADMSASSARRVSVRGSDVTGIELNLASLAAIAGRVNIETDPKLNCGRHRDAVLHETVIAVRRSRIDEKPDARKSKDKPTQTSDPLSFLLASSDAVPNDKGEINLRNLFAGVYRFETRLAGGGWYVKAITVGPNGPNIPRDGIALKSGDKITGVTISIAEGAASLRGHVSVAEGQRLPAGLRVYVVPAERESAENVLRFFEARAETDASFAIGNIAPGKYLIVVRPAEETDPGTVKSIRQDTAFRSKVLREAEAVKKEVSFKPCERATDYELPYSLPATPRQ
jgi:hypothetical protein